MTDNKLLICAAEAREAALCHKRVFDQLRAAMRVTARHWLVTDDADRLQVAVAVVIALNGPESQAGRQLEAEWKTLMNVSELLSGGMTPELVAKMESSLAAAESGGRIGIMPAWMQITGGAR